VTFVTNTEISSYFRINNTSVGNRRRIHEVQSTGSGDEVHRRCNAAIQMFLVFINRSVNLSIAAINHRYSVRPNPTFVDSTLEKSHECPILFTLGLMQSVGSV